MAGEQQQHDAGAGEQHDAESVALAALDGGGLALGRLGLGAPTRPRQNQARMPANATAGQIKSCGEAILARKLAKSPSSETTPPTTANNGPRSGQTTCQIFCSFNALPPIQSSALAPIFGTKRAHVNACWKMAANPGKSGRANCNLRECRHVNAE
ncbi:MAG: hypothetical protein NVV62_17920 [Terricaulis sp.]|nr:hypothetical protein [Terricaulis sp.]